MMMSATPMMVECSELPDRDAALSLCAMGMGRMVVEREAPMSSKDFKFSRKVSLYSDDAHPRDADVVSVAVSDDASRASSGYGDGAGHEFKGAPPPRECPIQPEMEVQPETEVLPTAGSKQPKPKYSTAVPYEEMKRLMRVYGPVKCLRVRASRESGKAAAPASIRRKFYRWFPDFHERFEVRPGGWYMPKIGHEEEMRWREGLRRRDQVVLAVKRNARRRTSAAMGRDVDALV